MAMSNLSIMGLYNFDSSVFNDLDVPTGIDKQVLIDTIIMECAEFELIYPDISIMKYAIKQWSAKEYWNWQKLYNTTNLSYNPIWNKDGTISETETITHDDKTTVDGEVIQTPDTTTTNTQRVSAFNSSSYENRQEDTQDITGDVTTTDDTITTYENEHQRTYTRTETGNIGITTTQSMIREEREIDMFNIYDIICGSFKKRFCLLVY